MINRIISSEMQKTKKSVLLLGPRQVGKSTLIAHLKPDLEINLADEMEYLTYSGKPEAFREKIEQSEAKIIYIDEIQRLPKLLNTIQALIDKNKNLKFYLTGSSARKLKRGEANLLPGRVVNYNLGPFVSSEFNYKMDTSKVLSFGSLPEIYLSKNENENKKILRSYAGNYLKEEIRAEALVRNLDSFSRFFNETSSYVAEFVDFTKMSTRAKISRHAIPRYFEILEDTLVGDRLNYFNSIDHGIDLIKHPKFYFFDNGVYNALLSNFTASLDRMGKLSEQLIFSQIKHSSWAQDKEIRISSFRTRAGVEVDFIIEIEQSLYAIEVKTNEHIISDDLVGLQFFNKAISQKKKLFVFHMGKNEKKQGNIWILPWQKGLQEIGL